MSVMKIVNFLVLEFTDITPKQLMMHDIQKSWNAKFVMSEK